MNIGKIFANRAFLSPQLEAFVGDGYRYTYAQANERINQFAHYLSQGERLQPQERIALLCKNNEHLATAIFAAAKIGAVAIPLNWRLQIPELTYILNDCGAKVLFYDGEFAGVVNELRAQIKIRTFLRKGGSGVDPEYEDILQGFSPEELPGEGGGDSPLIIMYTSGTTGRPKGAMLSHQNLFWATLGIAHTIDWRYRDRFLSIAPMFHIGGLAPIITNVHSGCTSVFMPDFDPVKVWQMVAQEKIQFMMTVPVMLGFMLKVLDKHKVDLSSLRHIVCGGAIVSAELINAYQSLGIAVENVYGITEYSGAVCFWTPEMGESKKKSVGKPVFHGQIRIANVEDGSELPPGGVGEIWCRGPQVFKGYWDNPAGTEKALHDGWYRSGDLGTKDAEGFIYVVDRLKDMIISGGENIYPAELEGVISQHPGVADVAVIGVPDNKWGEIPRAYVVKKEGAALVEGDIFETCRKNLAGYKCIKEVLFIDALPRNASGKVLKTVLKQKASQDS